MKQDPIVVGDTNPRTIHYHAVRTCPESIYVVPVPWTGYYSLPIRFRSIKDGNSSWFFFSDGKSTFCYEKTGADYYNSHSRLRGRCSEPVGRSPMPNRIKLSRVTGLEVFFDGSCSTEQVDVQLTRE